MALRVVWHTQGSGKSLSMTFYAERMVTHPDMQNPTLIVLTDRNHGQQLPEHIHIRNTGGRGPGIVMRQHGCQHVSAHSSELG
jgi:hypothetical protein